MNKDRSNEPDLQDIVDGAAEDLSYSLNSHRIGVIESFNPANQTATVKLVDKGVLVNANGETLLEFSLLTDCPVFIHKGINGGLTIPIVKGDTCLVCFNDRDMDNWLENGLVQRPNTLRAHDLSDAIAIVGIRNQINKITDYKNDATVLNYLDTKIILDDKVRVENTAEDLKSIMDAFIDIILNLQTVDPVTGLEPIDPATTAALNALLIRVGDLLK